MDQSDSIPVTGLDGLRGSIEPSIHEEMDERIVVRLEDGRTMSVPVSMLEPTGEGGYFLPMSPEQVPVNNEGTNASQTMMVIPVIAEDLHIRKQEKITGKVRISKQVREHDEIVDIPSYQDQILVERVPVNKVVDKPLSTRTEGDTTIYPVMEEIIVVERRYLLKEEVRVTRRREETHKPEKVTLRKEEIKVDRIKPDGESD